jgi:3-hydroxybutyryl-CoA dehydrogenase
MRTAIIGCGLMGSGIAQLAATSGHEVTAFDVSATARERAQAAAKRSLARFVKAGKLDRERADEVAAAITYTDDLAIAVSDAEVVIESVFEDLAVKRDVIEQAARLAPGDCLLGTNTSQLSITAIGARLEPQQAERFIGTHFFNPPVLMQLLELVRGLQTSDETVHRAREFAASLGREVVLVMKDSPGFITTRVSLAARLECLRILEEGVATAEDIDKACRLGLNFPMGPLELGDFNGVDTYLAAADSLAAVYGGRYRVPNLVRTLVAAGRTGRKSGHGIYRYTEDGSRIAGPSQA